MRRMRSRLALVHALLLCCVCMSCGASAPTVAPTTAPAPTPVASAPPPPEPAPDVSPLPEPAGLEVTVHLAHPRESFDRVAGLIKPLAMFFGNGKLDLESLLDKAAGAHVGAIIDLDQPIDVAFTDVDPDGGVKVAASGVIPDLATARPMLEREFLWKPIGSGIVRLELRPDMVTEDDSKKTCMVMPAPTGSRLVCGDATDSVQRLGPYLARTMTRLKATDDLRIEVFPRQLQTAKEEASRGSSSSGDPTDRVMQALTGKMADDVASVVLGVSFDGTTVDFRVHAKFAATASPLSKALIGLGAPGAPPAAFEHLPADAFFASYGRGAAAADLDPLRHILSGGLHDFIVKDGYTSDQADAVLAPLGKLVFTGGPWVVAFGNPPDRARAALDAYIGAGKTTEAARVKARAGSSGWVVAGVEEPASTWTAAVKALVLADGARPAKPKSKNDIEHMSTHLFIAPVPAGLQLPAGTLHVELRTARNPAWVAANPKPSSWMVDSFPPHTEHLFIVPDGARTWLGSSLDPALAAEKVRASMAGAPASGTLASRADLQAFRAMPASVAGFAAVTAFASLVGDNATDSDLRRARKVLDGLSRMTNGGSTPVPMTLSATPAAGGANGGGDVRMRVLFPVSIATEVAASMGSILP
jgi:hypothetical protein